LGAKSQISEALDYQTTVEWCKERLNPSLFELEIEDEFLVIDNSF
jgi:hypothetical protein